MMKEIEKKKNNNNMSLESEGSNTLIDTMFRFKITHQTSKKKKTMVRTTSIKQVVLSSNESAMTKKQQQQQNSDVQLKRSDEKAAMLS